MKLTICILAAMVLVAVGYIVGRWRARRERAEAVARGWVDDLCPFPEDLGGWHVYEKEAPLKAGTYIVIEIDSMHSALGEHVGWAMWDGYGWVDHSEAEEKTVLFWIEDPTGTETKHETRP